MAAVILEGATTTGGSIVSLVPPDWYPDPSDANFLRYWDGHDWTADRKPSSATSFIEHSQPSGVEASKVPLFGARAHAKRQSQELSDALSDNQRLREQLASCGGLEIVEFQRRRAQLMTEIADYEAQLDALRKQVIVTQQEQVLQEIGIYEFRHPLADSTTHRGSIKYLQNQIKEMARPDGGAIEASTTWTVGDSVTEGRRLTREYSKLMLRTYNIEADNLVRGLKPYKLQSALNRLDQAARTVERLGRTIQLRISPEYHRLRCYELELTADYLETIARQKAYERDQQEKLREERKAHEELVRDRTRLEKQEQQCRDALAAIESTGAESTSAADEMRERLRTLVQALAALAARENNLRAGFIYVISNIGAFGENEGVVMIGMTRRSKPAERIRELSNTSVPFKYDVHTTFYSDDAAGIEAELHRLLADKRVNKVNNRREFFRVSLAEVRDHLQSLTGSLIDFHEFAEAVEYRQSRALAQAREPESGASA